MVLISKEIERCLSFGQLLLTNIGHCFCKEEGHAAGKRRIAGEGSVVLRKARRKDGAQPVHVSPKDPQAADGFLLLRSACTVGQLRKVQCLPVLFSGVVPHPQAGGYDFRSIGGILTINPKDMALPKKRLPFLWRDGFQVPLAAATRDSKASFYFRVQDGEELFLIDQVFPQRVHAIAGVAHLDGSLISRGGFIRR